MEKRAHIACYHNPCYLQLRTRIIQLEGVLKNRERDLERLQKQLDASSGVTTAQLQEAQAQCQKAEAEQAILVSVRV